MFIEQRQVGQMAVFAYLVGDEAGGEAVVIDPAADTDGIIAAAEKRKVRITTIVNTHGHVDHTGGNVDMKKKTGASIVIHEDDAEMLVSAPDAMLRMFGAKASPPADRTVKEGDLIVAGVVTLRVIHTPGHSPGSTRASPRCSTRAVTRSRSSSGRRSTRRSRPSRTGARTSPTSSRASS